MEACPRLAVAVAVAKGVPGGRLGGAARQGLAVSIGELPLLLMRPVQRARMETKKSECHLQMMTRRCLGPLLKCRSCQLWSEARKILCSDGFAGAVNQIHAAGGQAATWTALGTICLVVLLCLSCSCFCCRPTCM